MTNAHLAAKYAQAALDEQENRKATAWILDHAERLKPLPKPHYSYPGNANIGTPELIESGRGMQLCYAIARLCGTLTVDGNASLPGEHEHGFLETLRTIQAETGCRIGVTFKETPAMPRYLADRFTERIGKLTELLGPVDHFLMDMEREPANEASVDYYNGLYVGIRKHQPDASVSWYGQGGWRAFAGTFQALPRTVHPNVMHTQYPTFAIYEPGNLAGMVQAAEHGEMPAVAYLSLGCSYEFGLRGKDESWKGSGQMWNWASRYPLTNSWQLGGFINQPWYGGDVGIKRYGAEALNQIETVVFYPQPWESRATLWPQHFMYYLMGANNMEVTRDLMPQGVPAEASA